MTNPGHLVRIAPNEISLSHPSAIKKVLATPLHKGSWYKVIAFPDGRFQNPMSATDPAVKNELSRHLSPAYTLPNLLRCEDKIDETLSVLFDWFDRFSSTGEKLELSDWFTFATSDVVGEVIFSRPFGFLREGRDIDDTIANSHPQAAYVSVAGFFRWIHVALLSNRFVTWLGITPWGHLIDTAMGAIQERLERPDVERVDALGHWLRMLDSTRDKASGGGKMEEHEVRSAAFNAVAAGNETVATGLQAFVYYMIRCPGAWERARKEVDQVLLNGRRRAPAEGRKNNNAGDGGGGGTTGVVSYADAQKMPYLQACIKEALRVFGPASMGLPRVVGKGGMTFGGDAGSDRGAAMAMIPEGTTVSVNIWVMHHSKEIWGEDAREFNPDRWFRPDAGRLDKYFIPWGVGYASCPGQNIARIELSKICATLVRDYDIWQADPAREWTWKAYFTVVPGGWSVYIRKRETKDR